MIFKTYNKKGQVLLDNQKSIFSFVKSGRLTRLTDKTFENNKRQVSYRAKRLGINSKIRNRWADIHTPEYCMYYIDVDNPISPIACVYYDGLAKDCNPVVYLNTGFFNGKARIMFYSNGRLSDVELAKFQIYIFDNTAIKETKAGLNTYDKQGKLTFSSRSVPMSVDDMVRHYQPSHEAMVEYEKHMSNIKHINQHIEFHVGGDSRLLHQQFLPQLYIHTNQLKELINKQVPALMSALGATKIAEKDLYVISLSKQQSGFNDILMETDVFNIVYVGCKEGLVFTVLPTFKGISTNGTYKSPELTDWSFQNQHYSIKLVDISYLPFPY